MSNKVLAALAAGAAAVVTTGLLLAAPAGAAPSPTAVFTQDSTWGSGYQGKYTITAGSTALTGWKLEFDLPAGSTPGSYWDATLASSGNHHTFTNREYNGSVAAGASTSFGFLVNGTGLPANCKLNGQPCAGSTTTTTTTTTSSSTTTTTTSSSTTTTTTTTPVPPGSIKSAPYVDITMPTPSLESVARATGQKVFTLAFALADSSGCNPSWGGTIPLNDSRIINDVRALKALGGDVIVATGGAAGPYLEYTCSTADALLGAYKKVLDAVGSNHLDVDVEASIPHDMVNTALKKLQTERGTSISYTMRVQGDDYGMDPYSVQILQNAAAKGLTVLVNPMTMEFGTSKPDWGDAVIAAAESSLRQMKQIWPGKSDAELKRLLGVTPMIGRNFNGKVFTQDHARKLVTWANTNRIGLLGFWSVGRDNGSCPGGGVSPTCSSIAQSQYEFTTLFKGFTA
ncbi:cellulose binding domain-containing protein [Saccharothrix variisporea]|uniref:Cellulose binding domain-containing protein n=1 Tax=Saccharothrix variisporea TaxID=543527 RepID=A0A495XFU0_9PSEU|nr:cellulose binding domain-containing protein [Saccharothrix variisporea]RKT72867.1 cellulose binding domain-containing protein [Saccharothrix variisporea]